MRVLCIVNTRAGLGDAGLYDFLRAVGQTGAEITLRFLTGGATLRDLTRDAEEYDRVIAAGGDGTVSGVCYALRDRKVPILAYPAGTANLLALNLRMPLDPNELAHIALGDSMVDFDLGELEICEQGDPRRRKEGFMIAAGAGFDAAIMETASELKSSIGVAAYLVGALQNLTPTVARFKLTLDGVEKETEGIAVLIANFARLQFDISITHDSDPTDGVFEVVVLRTRNAIELLPAVWAAIIDRTTGLHPDRTAGLEVHSARTVRAESEPALTMQFDGDTLPCMTPFETRVHAGAARLLVPEVYLDAR